MRPARGRAAPAPAPAPATAPAPAPGAGGQGKQHREGAAPSRTGALRARDAAVMADHVTDDVEAQPETVVGAGARGVLLAEPLESERQEGRAHPLAVVLDPEPGLPVRRVQGHLDAAPGWRELDGVRQQVRDGLLQPARVTRHPDRHLPVRRVERQPLDRRVPGRGVQGHLDDTPEVDELRAEHEPAGGDARRVEEVLDDALQGARAALDDLEGAVGLGGIGFSLPEETEPHQDRSERRPQLVGEQRQELVLEAARVHRAVPRGLLPLQERGDVADHPAAVDELLVPREAVRPDQHASDGAVPRPQAHLVVLDRLLATEAAEHLVGGLGLDEVPGDGVAARLVLGAPEQLPAGAVRPEQEPFGIHPADTDRGVGEELDELLAALGWPLGVGRRAVAHQSTRSRRERLARGGRRHLGALTLEHLRHERPRIVVVFHDQHPDAREVGGVVQADSPVRLRVDTPVGRLGRDGRTGELYRERGALASPGALGLDAAAVMRSVASVPTMSPLRPPSGAT